MTRWSERQRTMLRAMGLAPWLPAAGEPADVAAPVATPPPATERVPAPARTAHATAPTPAPAPPPPADDERARHIATLDWPALREAARTCSACGLSRQRTQAVFGVGHEQAHWMIVGEAPGEQEDRQGEPFVGAAGQLLDRMLAAIGLTRGEAEPARQVYIANTLKCRPPRNRNPEPEESQACAPLLARQIELVRPRLILAMGRFAAQRLLGTDEAIGRLRGQVHRHAARHGEVPVVVTYHPAYLLRNPADKARAWADLCLARHALERPPAH